MAGNVADVFLNEDGKYYAYLGNKKLCQSKRIMDIEMLLLVKKWTKKAQDANIERLNFHFDERLARDKETPVVEKETPSDKYIITKNGNVTTVIANDEAEPDMFMSPKDQHEIRQMAYKLNESGSSLRRNYYNSNNNVWVYS
jgi:hypothetical protein